MEGAGGGAGGQGQEKEEEEEEDGDRWQLWLIRAEKHTTEWIVEKEPWVLKELPWSAVAQQVDVIVISLVI